MRVALSQAKLDIIPVDFRADPDGNWEYDALARGVGFDERWGHMSVGALTQPFAGAMADKVGAGRVLLVGALLVAIGTFITPYMTTTAGLIFAIGVLSAGGAGMAGPAVLMAATTRLIAPEKRGLATGIVNAGGSFGQFIMAPIAAADPRRRAPFAGRT